MAVVRFEDGKSYITSSRFEAEMKLISLLTSFRQSVQSQWMVQDIRLIDTITPKPNHNSLLLSTIRLGRGFYGSHLVHTYTVTYRTYFNIQSLTRWVTGSLEKALVSTKVILTIRRLEFSANHADNIHHEMPFNLFEPAKTGQIWTNQIVATSRRSATTDTSGKRGLNQSEHLFQKVAYFD